jgi:uncharacterized protein YjaZ
MLQLEFFDNVARPSDDEDNGPLRTLFERALRRVEREVAPLLPLPARIVIAAGADPARAIPETGVAARAWSEDRIDVWVAPRNPWVQAAGEEELVAMLAHELHHCARWNRPGYGLTLAEAMVSEGLACHFETRFRGGVPPFWARALDEPTLRRVEAQAWELLDSRHYDHRAWFGGAANAPGASAARAATAPASSPSRIRNVVVGAAPAGTMAPFVPRHAGHTLGFRIAARHLRRTGRSAAQLVNAPAQVFFD